MNIAKMDYKVITEVRKALKSIFFSAETTSRKLYKSHFLMGNIEREVFRIERLLPKIIKGDN